MSWLLHLGARLRLVVGLCLASIAFGCQVTECVSDQHCAAEQICLSGSCVDVCSGTDSCSDHQECRGKYDAANLRWEEPLLCRDGNSCHCDDDSASCVSILGSGKACVQYQSCTTDGCPEGYECLTVTGQEACVCSQGDCGPSCKKDSDCLGALKCDDGQCQVRSCTGPGDCDSGDVCGVVSADGQLQLNCVRQGSKTVGESCASSADCRSGLCGALAGEGNVCQQLCEDNRDCGEGSECIRADSVSELGVRLCAEVDGVCGGAEQAVLGSSGFSCTLGETCEGEQDCLGGLTCIAGLCACSSEQCARECKVDLDCGTQGFCNDGNCVLKAACESADDCEAGQACSIAPGESAAGKHCQPAGELASGEECESGRDCASGICDGTCQQLCSKTHECGDGQECAVRSINSESLGTCVTAGCGCSGDEVCGLDGRCVVATICTSSSACDEGLECLGGTCQKTCDRTSDCDMGACTLVPELGDYVCVEAGCDCAGEEVCRGGTCEAAAGCRIDSQCGDGQLCWEGQCREECSQHDDCTDGECVAELMADGALTRLCGPATCNCDLPDAWCLPGQGQTGNVCFKGTDCSACDIEAGFSCIGLPGRFDDTQAQACGCSSNVLCGSLCETDEQCGEGLVCAPHGRCDVAGVCRNTGECAEGEDCFVGAGGAFELGACQPAQCFCGQDDMCLAASVGGSCVRPQNCSVLEPKCPDYYACDVATDLCICDAYEECGAPCSSSEQCQPGWLCQDSRCTAIDCERDSDCPRGSVCGGGGDNRSCAVPGPRADGELCDHFSQCASGYCFAENTCARTCMMNADCPAGLSCMLYEPEKFGGQLPICTAEPARCDATCSPAQYCDNAAQDPRCLPEATQ